MFFDKLWVRIKGEFAMRWDDRDTDAEPAQPLPKVPESVARKPLPSDEGTLPTSRETTAGSPETGDSGSKPGPAGAESSLTTAEPAFEASSAGLKPNPRRLG